MVKPIILIDGIVLIITNSTIAFIDLILSNHLKDYNYSDEQIAAIYVLITSIYLATSLTLSLIADKINKKLGIFVAISANSLGTFLGSDLIIQTEGSYLCVIGICLCMLGMSISIVIALPSMLESAKTYLGF